MNPNLLHHYSQQTVDCIKKEMQNCKPKRNRFDDFCSGMILFVIGFLLLWVTRQPVQSPIVVTQTVNVASPQPQVIYKDVPVYKTIIKYVKPKPNCSCVYR